jgi:hypothetical protein
MIPARYQPHFFGVEIYLVLEIEDSATRMA